MFGRFIESDLNKGLLPLREITGVHNPIVYKIPYIYRMRMIYMV